MNPWFFVIGVVALLAARFDLAAQHWPQFRGPRGDGSSDSVGLPLTWSETNHIKWKTPIHGRAWSSPVIWDRQIWLTTATEDGLQLFAVCIDRDTGKIIHDLKLFDVARQTDIRKYNTYASPTPVIEPGRLYVTFGSAATACLDTKTGGVLWARRDLECNHYRGPGSSPIVFENLLIMNFDGSDHHFVIALNKETGKTVWRKERSIDYKDLDADGKPQTEGDLRKAFSTPHVATLDGVPTLLSQGAKAAYGYDPRTGTELWRVEERTSHSAADRPLVGHGLVFLTTGFSKGELLAIRPGRNGEVIDARGDTVSDASTRLGIAWKSRRNVPRKPSLILAGDLLFGVEDDGGMASCYEAKTGAEVWRERLGGTYTASPLLAGNRIYFFNEEGKAVIIEAGRVFKKLAENSLADGCKASPAVSGNALLVRTFTHLYRIEE
jgi:outer membrane protein assembly factor BamB